MNYWEYYGIAPGVAAEGEQHAQEAADWLDVLVDAVCENREVYGEYAPPAILAVEMLMHSEKNSEAYFYIYFALANALVRLASVRDSGYVPYDPISGLDFHTDDEEK